MRHRDNTTRMLQNALQTSVDSIRNKYPKDTVTIISHSRGTMVAMAAVAIAGNAPDALFVLNSPYALDHNDLNGASLPADECISPEGRQNTLTVWSYKRLPRYTLARTHLAGLYGMNEGLALLAAPVVRQWGSLWPQPVHARVEILSALSKRLQQVMRTLTLTYADLGQLYQAEENLNALSDMLQRLELKHAAQLDALRSMMQNAAVRLENSENTGVSLPGNAVGAAELHLTEPTEHCKRVYVVQPEPLLNKEPPVSVKQWKPFAAGMLSMLVAASVVAVGWQMMHAPDSAQMQLAASPAPIPEGLSTAQLQALQQTSPPPEPGDQ